MTLKSRNVIGKKCREPGTLPTPLPFDWLADIHSSRNGGSLIKRRLVSSPLNEFEGSLSVNTG